MTESKPRIFYVWPKRKGEFFGSILAVEDFESAINPDCKELSFKAIEFSAYEKLQSEVRADNADFVKIGKELQAEREKTKELVDGIRAIKFSGCRTGDCPHEKQFDCDKAFHALTSELIRKHGG